MKKHLKHSHFSFTNFFVVCLFPTNTRNFWQKGPNVLKKESEKWWETDKLKKNLENRQSEYKVAHSKPPQALWGNAKRGIFFIFLNFFTFTRRAKKITFFFVKNLTKTCTLFLSHLKITCSKFTFFTLCFKVRK